VAGGRRAGDDQHSGEQITELGIGAGNPDWMTDLVGSSAVRHAEDQRDGVAPGLARTLICGTVGLVGPAMDDAIKLRDRYGLVVCSAWREDSIQVGAVAALDALVSGSDNGAGTTR
jgi:hypothetical protein